MYKLVYIGSRGEWKRSFSGYGILDEATEDDVVPEEDIYMVSSLDPYKFYLIQFHHTTEWSMIQDLVSLKRLYVKRKNIPSNSKPPVDINTGNRQLSLI